MSTFIAALERLRGEAQWTAACENILSDRACDKHPHGIPAQLLAEAETHYGGDQNVKETVSCHNSHHRPDLQVPVVCKAKAYSRFLPLSIFKRHHIGVSAMERSLPNPGEQKEIPLREFLGSSSREDKPAWWSWDCGPRDHSDCLNLARELNLGNEVVEYLELGDKLVEIVFSKQLLDKCLSVLDPQYPHLFRPTGFDGFGEHTAFRPNSNPNEAFGRTCPRSPSKKMPGWPEAVSKHFEYKDLGNSDSVITVNHLKT